MKTSLPHRLTAAATLLACTAATLLPAASPTKFRQATTRSLMSSFAAEMLATDSLRSDERNFLAKAEESSRQQMRLAQVGISQATSSEVRSHALQLAGDYRQLSDGLEALIRRKGGIAGAPVGGTSETYQKLAEKSGADFDRDFVLAVAAQSNDVMSLFELAATNAKDADVRDFAASELPTLRAHRNAVLELKKSVE